MVVSYIVKVNLERKTPKKLRLWIVQMMMLMSQLAQNGKLFKLGIQNLFKSKINQTENVFRLKNILVETLT